VQRCIIMQISFQSRNFFEFPAALANKFAITILIFAFTFLLELDWWNALFTISSETYTRCVLFKSNNDPICIIRSRTSRKFDTVARDPAGTNKRLRVSVLNGTPDLFSFVRRIRSFDFYKNRVS
jgi:hypothetical protein